MTATVAFALPAVLAWLGLRRYHRDAADALALPAATALWIAAILVVIVITWS